MKNKKSFMRASFDFLSTKMVDKEILQKKKDIGANISFYLYLIPLSLQLNESE
jgi:hypothetical protein